MSSWPSLTASGLRHGGETFTVNAMVHPSGAVVDVMTHHGTNTSEAFDERRIGLDHLSFQVADRNELPECTTHLDAKGVAHSGIIDLDKAQPWSFATPTTSSSSSTSTQTTLSRGAETTSVREMYAEHGVFAYRHARSR